MADSVVGLLVARQVTALDAACIIGVAEGDPTRATLVATDEYTGESARDRIVIVCMSSHPQDDAWQNEVQQGYKADLGFELPNEGRGLIGGTKFDIIRGTVKVICQLEETGAEALNIREAVLARVESTLQRDLTMTGFTDDFGAAVQFFNVARVQKFKQVRGGQTAYVDWAALVTKPR